jgi:ribonuclease G
MTKELVISANRHETKVAILEDDQLVEVYFQRSNEYSLAGSIHKGRVTRVLPGMQSAFVDLGLERDTFLYVSDFFEEHQEEFEPVDEKPRDGRGRDRDRGRERDERQRPRRDDFTKVSPGPEPAAAPAAAEGEAGAARSEAVRDRGEERGPDRGDRDRRGRRGRRRRGRTRGGLPESKYAEAPRADEAEEAASGAAAPDEAETGSGPQDLLILPGESLRKYRGAAAPEEAPAAEEAEEVEEEAEEIAAGEAEGEEIDAAENPYDEPIHYPPDNAEPDAPLEVHALGEAPAEAAGEEPFPEAAPEDEAGPAGEPEAAERAGIAPLDDAEDREIQEMILSGEVEELEAAESEGEEAAEAEEEAASGPGAGTSGAAAQVRETGGRFLRRMPRRGRGRRGRPEGEGESRGERPPAGEAPERSERLERAERLARPTPSISELLKEGQEILVQIAKEPLGQKGARITSHIALPGRYVVYMPTLEHMGVSRKIGSDEERARLKRILQSQREKLAGGFITRTAAEGRTEEEIVADMTFLANLWIEIRKKAERHPAPLLLHHDLDIVSRILRDQLTDNFKAIWVDNEEVYEGVIRFVERFQPSLVSRVRLYTREVPIFDAFNVSSELEKALRPKVWLKSGGYIVINQTEALVAIDVNTGKFVGKSNRLEDTIVKTNMEAIKEIVRQVRLRDLGGIIVIDFIDMDERKNRQKVMQALEEAMRADRAPYKILQFNDFGLVAITRKRVKQSLERTLCSPCPHCDGAGYIKSVQTVIGEILQEAAKMAKVVEGKDVMLRVHPDVAKVLKSHQNRYLEELEEILKRPVLVKGDPALHHEKFDLA